MNNFKAHILVVDDDDGIRNLVKKFLNRNKYLVTTASNALEAENKLKLIKFDLIVLDIMMPGKSGLEFIDENKFKLKTPIILLTAKGDISDRIEGFETGADDYLPKPFEPKELELRINSILRRTQKDKIRHIVEFKNLKIDLKKMYIIKKDKQFKINTTEKKILEQMINLPGKIFSRISIGDLINVDKERSVDVIITRLRKKVEVDPKNPRFLQTVRGEGYVFWIE
tara:strand:- start:499 stop:1176 length:678 start_codon:yes stop_codon:yes gene_type:complete